MINAHSFKKAISVLGGGGGGTNGWSACLSSICTSVLAAADGQLEQSSFTVLVELVVEDSDLFKFRMMPVSERALLASCD
jgi:hypothetical protein